MTRKDHELIGILIRRVEWREGSVFDRLRTVEKRAEWRAKTGAYGCDTKRERQLARLARRTRKAMKRERARSIARANASQPRRKTFTDA